jgi:hypothetical protein
MIAERRPALVVEVVEQRRDAPGLLVLAEPGVAAHRGLDAQHVSAGSRLYSVGSAQASSDSW